MPDVLGRLDGGDTAWIAPTLLNSWVNVGGTNSTAGFRKDALGFVHLKGQIKSGSSTTAVMFVLPAGYRPGQDLDIVTTCSNGSALVNADLGIIASSGNVALRDGATSFALLDGITFLAEQ